MRKCYCDICGEEIKADDDFMTFTVYSERENEEIRVDTHGDCYSQLFCRIKRCVEGDRITRAKRV